MVLSGQDPRRADKVTRYKPPKEKAAGEDPIPEYMNLLAMLFSICGLMMKVRTWAIMVVSSSVLKSSCLLSG